MSGNRRIFVVKCLTLECCDFRVIRLTFVDFTQTAQPSISLTETLKQSLLIPNVNPTRGEMTSRISKDSPSAKTKKLHVVSCNDYKDCDGWSLCEDDDLEEEEIVNEAAQPSQHSPRFAKRKKIHMCYILAGRSIRKINIFTERKYFLSTDQPKL